MAGVEQRGGQPQPDKPRQPEQSQKSPEAGAGPLGLPPPDSEQTPHDRGSKSPECQTLPSVWDVVGRKWRFFTREVPMTEDEHFNERSEIWRLEAELKERGTPRDKLILDLFTYGVILRPDPDRRASFKPLVPKDFQQFRSLVQKSSDEELTEELRKHEPEVETPEQRERRFATGTFS